jgi:uncharacterized membrane protein YphA (DoxX/SURF4 family)
MNTLFLLRLAVGILFINHSVPKLREPQKMASGMNWTNVQVMGLGIIEFMSAIGIIGGVAIRISALLLSCVMLAAIYYKMKRWHVPFISNNSTGWELDFMVLAATLTIYLYH